MGENMEENEEGNTLNMFEIGNEISSLVAKGKISSTIGEKIKEKIRERGVSLSKEQLYKLVDRINESLRSQPSSAPSSHSSTPPPVHRSDDVIETKNLLESLENFNKRIESLEKAQTHWMKNWLQYTTEYGKTGVPETVTMPSTHQEMSSMYPLASIPSDPESIVVVMKWLQYLVDKVGKSRVLEVLNYYVDVGWITEEAKMKLLEYCEGITVREGSETNASELLAKDHIQSFLFIQKLMGSKVDEYFLNRIERDISKLIKNLDNLSLH
ncbi:MAG TPA: hypothetical protein EYP23_04750 [Thermoplasmata archaeon]|nr:hypothetical protein [Thermoplasmata archaeon]